MDQEIGQRRGEEMKQQETVVLIYLGPHLGESFQSDKLQARILHLPNGRIARGVHIPS